MIVVRVILNLFILAIEIGLVVAVAALGYLDPVKLALLTFVLALVIGMRLEILRLGGEMSFYFAPNADGSSPRPGVGLLLVAVGEALVKALLAGLVALLTFSGTDPTRLMWIAIAFGVCVFAGSSILRWLGNRHDARPGRWGYFRIAAPLGVLFSAAIALLPAPSFGQVGWDLVFNLPQRPSLPQASEVLFMLKQKFDELVLLMLQKVLPAEAAAVVAVVVSVNMLTGFLAGIYAVVAAETVRFLERGVP
jgi:hypothetical protein